MKMSLFSWSIGGGIPALAGVLAVLAMSAPPLGAAPAHREVLTSAVTHTSVAAEDADESPPALAIETIEETRSDDDWAGKETAWLGVGASEASEALSAQLGLDPGVGLVVTYVAADSPAAKAGLEKNDVLVELAGQQLVHPAQLRKLVQARKVGDTIPLAYYRGGQRQTATATLAKGKPAFELMGDEQGWGRQMDELKRQLRNLAGSEEAKESARMMREALRHVQINQGKVQDEVRHALEDAQKAMREALRHATNAHAALGPLAGVLESLSKSGLSFDHHAVVTVQDSEDSAKSIIKSDDAGTIVLVNKPKLHLTAHDQDGQLVFDGPIETEEQRAEVPKELWKRAEPLLDKMNSGEK